MTEADSLRAYIAAKQKQMDDLLFRYGDSVRPAWVGEEIGIIAGYKEDAEHQLAKLESKNAN